MISSGEDEEVQQSHDGVEEEHAVVAHTRPDEDADPHPSNEADSHTEEEAEDGAHNNDHNTDQQPPPGNKLHAVPLYHQDGQPHDENEEVVQMNVSQPQWHHVVDDDTDDRTNGHEPRLPPVVDTRSNTHLDAWKKEALPPWP
mmetsp:Transcript_26214/g.56293  ORF Transcript_26214/g.56293 Transcript_26214/m.56293 type:complete len:143 (-) Transcript_26214:3260-3688(-)